MPIRIQTPCIDLEQSLAYYERLGFVRISQDPVIVSDGQIQIEINPEPSARTGIVIETADREALVKKLPTGGHIKQGKKDLILMAPGGTRVYLREPAGRIAMQEIAPSLLGKCVGISLESVDMLGSHDFWTALGFEAQTDGSGGWMPLNREGFEMSVMAVEMCPHLFLNPSLTYFNGKDSQQIIARLQEKGVPIWQEVRSFNPEGPLENVILQDPGGLGIFVFND